MAKKKKKKAVCGYYRPHNTTPNWYEIWTDEIIRGVPAENVLDELCRVACGVEIGASDQVQRNAKHIHSCLIAAYKMGKADNLPPVGQKGEDMTYFSNGSEGDQYVTKYCERCLNQKTEVETEIEGCSIMDVHLLYNYDQCKDTDKGKAVKEILALLIPTNDNGFGAECSMFRLDPDADIPGQQKLDFAKV